MLNYTIILTMKNPTLEEFKIEKRKLKNKEIEILINEIQNFPAPFYIRKKVWISYTNNYILKINSQFAGVFVLNRYGDWFKLGPFIILKKFQNKGFGKILLSRIFEDYKLTKFFLVTPSLAVKKLAKQFQFKRIKNYFFLPIDLKILLLKQILDYSDFIFIKEIIRKSLLFKRDKTEYFIKTPDLSC